MIYFILLLVVFVHAFLLYLTFLRTLLYVITHIVRKCTHCEADLSLIPFLLLRITILLLQFHQSSHTIYRTPPPPNNWRASGPLGPPPPIPPRIHSHLVPTGPHDRPILNQQTCHDHCHSRSSIVSKALPSITNIPLLTSKIDFFAWDEGVTTLLRANAIQWTTWTYFGSFLADGSISSWSRR